MFIRKCFPDPGTRASRSRATSSTSCAREESDDIWRPGFVVKQIRAAWDEVANEAMWAEPESERWPTLGKARERCEARRDALQAQGFDSSDMELL